MKDELKDRLLFALTPFITSGTASDVSMKLDLILKDYEIGKAENSVIVYEGNKNEIVLQKFLMAKIARGCTKRTVNYYRTSLSYIFDRLNKPYDEVTAEDLRIYLAVRVQMDNVSKTTANNERRNLSAFYGWLQTEEILLKNPMKKIEAIKETKKKKQAFTQMEIEKIRYSCCSCREEAIIELLLSTWARVSEIAQIRLDEIRDNEILVHGKGDKDRVVYLNARARLALDRYLAERKDKNPYLFARTKHAGDVGSWYIEKRLKRNEMKKWYIYPELVSEADYIETSTIEQIVKKIGKKAQVDNVHPHRFRRTGATNALRSGMPLITVSKLLGHVNIGTTQIYLDISDKEMESAHERYVV